MRDVDDRHATRLEISNDPEQDPDFLCAERGSRLIHHQNPHLTGQRLRDLDDLLLAERQLANQSGGVDGVLQSLQQLLRFFFLTAFVENTMNGQLASQKNVLRDAEVWTKIQFLVNDADSVGIGIANGTESNLDAIEQQGSAGGLFDSGEYSSPAWICPRRSRRSAR